MFGALAPPGHSKLFDCEIAEAKESKECVAL
jgi:hypothetical protein